MYSRSIAVVCALLSSPPPAAAPCDSELSSVCSRALWASTGSATLRARMPLMALTTVEKRNDSGREGTVLLAWPDLEPASNSVMLPNPLLVGPPPGSSPSLPERDRDLDLERDRDRSRFRELRRETLSSAERDRLCRGGRVEDARVRFLRQLR